MHYRVYKWIIFSVSLILVVVGGTTLGVTGWALLKTDLLHQLVRSSGTGLYVLITTVALLFVTGCLGLVAVSRRSQPVLGSFAVLLMVSLVSSIVGGSLLYITSHRADEMAQQRLVDYVRHDYGRDSSKTAILDYIQQSFQCCGSDDFSSWSQSPYGRDQHNRSGSSKTQATSLLNDDLFTVPESCCFEPSSEICRTRRRFSTKNTSSTAHQFIYTEGCVKSLQSTSIPYGMYVVLGCTLAGLLQVSGLVSSILLYRAFRYLDHQVINEP